MATDNNPIADFLDYKAHNEGLADATIYKYDGYLSGLSEWLDGQGVPLLDAETDHLVEFTGLHAHRQGQSPRSRRPMISSVRGFFKWAEKKGLIATDPASSLPYPNAPRRLPRALQLKNAEALIMQPDISTFLGVRDAAIIGVLIGCGIRLSGLVAIDEEDLFWVDEDGIEWLVLRVTEKGGKERMVPAPHECGLLVRAYLGHPDLDLIDRRLEDGHQVLFVSTNSKFVPEHEYRGARRRISRDAVQRLIIKHGTAAGLPRAELHPHAIRHLYGTELAEDEVDVLRIQALMGHAKPETSAEYVRLAVRTLSKTVAKSSPLVKINTPVSELARDIVRLRKSRKLR